MATKIDQDQFQLILKSLPTQRDKTLLTVGYYTGFRISELLSITLEDVSVQGVLKDSITVARKNMKGKGRSRTVALHAKVKEALSTYIQSIGVVGPEYRLFDITRQTFDHALKQAALRSGITQVVSAHSLRKSFGQRVYERTGKDIYATQRALGHKSLHSTSYYLSVDSDLIDKAILSE